MKKSHQLQVIILSLFFVNVMYSQTAGVPFAPDRTHWSEKAMYRISFTTMNLVYTNIRVQGDTIINDKYCQKLFTSGSDGFDTTCMQFFAYTYYKDKKLYADPSPTIDSTSILLYDFNLNAGDTFNLYVSNTIGCIGHSGYYKIAVDHCDSMYYGSQWRKRIVFETMTGFEFGPTAITWVEGIGDIDHGLSSCIFCGIGSYGFYGGLNNFYGITEHCYCNNGYIKLNCFQEPGYAPSGIDCTTSSCATTGVNDINDLDNIRIFPNPSTDKVFIEKNSTGLMELTLFDLIGKKITEEEIAGQKTEMDLSSLKPGIYFIQITTADKVFKRKIVIQR